MSLALRLQPSDVLIISSGRPQEPRAQRRLLEVADQIAAFLRALAELRAIGGVRAAGSGICKGFTGAASVGKSRAGARRRSERRRFSSASDDDGAGFQARCASSANMLAGGVVLHLRDQAPLLKYGQWLLLTVEVVECERRVRTPCWLLFWLR
jgi:hypothetical protein